MKSVVRCRPGPQCGLFGRIFLRFDSRGFPSHTVSIFRVYFYVSFIVSASNALVHLRFTDLFHETRKHTSRMRTAHPPTSTCFSSQPPCVSPRGGAGLDWGGGGSLYGDIQDISCVVVT